MHIGSCEAEGPTLARLHNEYMPAHGFTFNGPHHETYLSDPPKTAPERARPFSANPSESFEIDRDWPSRADVDARIVVQKQDHL